jgi:hypothetical protein
MTGNRNPGSATSSTTDVGEHGPPHNFTNLVPGATILRRSESASRPSPLTRVDLRSSLDPDPSSAYARTEPEMRRNRSQPPDLPGLTRPRSFRDDLLVVLSGWVGLEPTASSLNGSRPFKHIDFVVAWPAV